MSGRCKMFKKKTSLNIYSIHKETPWKPPTAPQHPLKSSFICFCLLTTVFRKPFVVLTCSFKPFLPPCSNGPDLLEGYGADRDGVHRAGGGAAVSVPAEHHHCGVHSLPGHHLLHHLSQNLLQTSACAPAGRWSTPLPVSDLFSSF